MMRYYWGFTIGHTYAHIQQSATSQGLTKEDNENPTFDLNQPEELDTNTGDELEFSIENLEDDIPAEDDNLIEEDNPAIGNHGDVDPNDYYDMYT